MAIEHTREEPNGFNGTIRIINVGPKGPRYGDQIEIKVDWASQTRQAVVDLMVAACWGGPDKAIEYYERRPCLPPHVERKIVWQRDGGGWDEKRELCPATLEEFRQWIKDLESGQLVMPKSE